MKKVGVTSIDGVLVNAISDLFHPFIRYVFFHFVFPVYV